MPLSQKLHSIESIWEYLKHRSEQPQHIATTGKFPSFHEWEILTTDVISAYPGSGKTKEATRLANELWEQWKLPTLYLMLSHQIIEERFKTMAEHGEAADWAHWRRHGDNCERRTYNDAGYLGYGECTCGRGQLKAGLPTLAPMEYVLPSVPDSGFPLINAANEFFLWIIDEIDLRRLLGSRTVTKAEVVKVGATHPDPTIRVLCEKLGSLMQTSAAFRLNGNALYEAFTQTVMENRPECTDLVERLRNVEATMKPWLAAADGPHPFNFPPHFVPVFFEEIRWWIQGEPFNPRIHLVGTGSSAELRIWWRKELEYPLEPGPTPAPTFVLDATADPDLLGLVFNISAKVYKDVPPWPKEVTVHQWADDLVTRTSLGIPYKGSLNAPKSKAARQRWYGRIGDALKDFPPDWPIGIITHQGIEAEAKGAIESMGFTDVDSLHYGDDRGSNLLEDVRVLVLLGLPIPNVDGFKEEAQAFLYDVGMLDFTWEDREQHLEMRDGPPVPVTVGGYWAEPVASYYRQKCQFGLYQAVHRIRPYLVKPGDERHVFIFTNMPVQDVKVADLLRDAESERIVNRFDRAIAALTEQLDAKGECTVPELAGLVVLEGEDERSMGRWVGENGEKLAAATGSIFTAGDRGRSGLFARTG